MSTETISMKLDADAARAFESAPKEDRDKIAILIGRWVLEYARADAGSLKETMDEVGRRASDRGLTPEILQSVLEAE